LSLEYIPIRKVKHFSISKKQPTEHDLWQSDQNR
jgi:hypothetical protein